MPIYAYKCQGCGHQFDKIQRLSDAPLTDCPQCNQSQLKKQITAAAFKLTGTGWYETDFKNNKKDTGKSNSTDGTSSSEKSTAKSDSSSTSSDSKSKSTSTKSASSKDAA